MELSHKYLKDFPKYNFLVLAISICAIYAPVLSEMIADWYNDPNYSHGFLVPVVSGYFLVQNWDELKRTPLRPNNFGLMVVMAALAILVFGFIGTEYYSMRLSIVLLIGGVVLFWFGWSVFRLSSLSISFLIFMIPLPYIVYDAIAFPLKLFVTKSSVAVLQLLSIPVVREGNIIMFPQTVLEVADACSGLRSLMSLITLAVALAFITQTSPLKRSILIVSAIPVAIITNMFRVITTGVLASNFGAAAAEGFFHEFAGMAVFLLAMALLFAESTFLKKVGK
jgi:exosortase